MQKNILLLKKICFHPKFRRFESGESVRLRMGILTRQEMHDCWTRSCCLFSKQKCDVISCQPFQWIFDRCREGMWSRTRMWCRARGRCSRTRRSPSVCTSRHSLKSSKHTGILSLKLLLNYDNAFKFMYNKYVSK